MGFYDNLRIVAQHSTDTPEAEREFLWRERNELVKQLNLTRRETEKAIARQQLEDHKAEVAIRAAALKAMTALAETEGKNARVQLQTIQKDVDSIRDSMVDLRGNSERRARQLILRAIDQVGGLGSDAQRRTAWKMLFGGAAGEAAMISGAEPELVQIHDNALNMLGQPPTDEAGFAVRYRKMQTQVTEQRDIQDAITGGLFDAMDKYAAGQTTAEDALAAARGAIDAVSSGRLKLRAPEQAPAELAETQLEDDEFFQGMKERYEQLIAMTDQGPTDGMERLGELVGSSDNPTPFRKWAESNGARLGEATLDEEGDVVGYIPGRDDIAALYRAYSQMRRKPDSLLRKSTGEWVRVRVKGETDPSFVEQYGDDGDFYFVEDEDGQQTFLTAAQAASIMNTLGQTAPGVPGEKPGPIVQVTQSPPTEDFNVYGKRVRQHISDPEDSIRVLTESGDRLFGPDEIVETEITKTAARPGQRFHDTLMGALGRAATKTSEVGAGTPPDERDPVTDVGLRVGSDLPKTPVDKTAERRRQVLERIARQEGRAEKRAERREARQEVWEPVRKKAEETVRGIGKKFRTELPDVSGERAIGEPAEPDLEGQVPGQVPGVRVIEGAQTFGRTLEEGAYHPLRESAERVREAHRTKRQMQREAVDPEARMPEAPREEETESFMEKPARPSAVRAEQSRREREDEGPTAQDRAQRESVQEAAKRRRLGRQSELERKGKPGADVAPPASQGPTMESGEHRVTYKSPPPEPKGRVLPVGPDPGSAEPSPLEMPKEAQEKGKKDYQEAQDRGEQPLTEAEKLKKKRRKYMREYVARTA